MTAEISKVLSCRPWSSSRKWAVTDSD